MQHGVPSILPSSIFQYATTEVESADTPSGIGSQRSLSSRSNPTVRLVNLASCEGKAPTKELLANLKYLLSPVSWPNCEGIVAFLVKGLSDKSKPRVSKVRPPISLGSAVNMLAERSMLRVKPVSRPISEGMSPEM